MLGFLCQVHLPFCSPSITDDLFSLSSHPTLCLKCVTYPSSSFPNATALKDSYSDPPAGYNLLLLGSPVRLCLYTSHYPVHCIFILGFLPHLRQRAEKLSRYDTSMDGLQWISAFSWGALRPEELLLTAACFLLRFEYEKWHVWTCPNLTTAAIPADPPLRAVFY